MFSLWGIYAVLLMTIAGTINALAILRGSFASLYLDPRHNKVLHELLLRVGAGIDLGQGAQLGVRAEDQVGPGTGPFDRARFVEGLEYVLRFLVQSPLRAHLQQIDEEVVCQCADAICKDTMLVTMGVAPRTRKPPTNTVISGADKADLGEVAKAALSPFMVSNACANSHWRPPSSALGKHRRTGACFSRVGYHCSEIWCAQIA